MRMTRAGRTWWFRTWPGRGLALLILGALLAGAGCRQPATNSQQPPIPPPQEYIDWLIPNAALREWEQFPGYWNYRAAELRPFDAAERIVFGEVTGVTWLNKTRNAKRFYRLLNTNMNEFRMVAQVNVIKCSPGNWRERLRLKFSVLDGTGLSGADPWVLAPGNLYLLLIPRGTDRTRLLPSDEDGPPPIPIAAAARDAGGDALQIDDITRLLLASLHAGDDEVSRYAVPVLGYLAQMHDQQDARVEVLALARGDDEVLTVAAIESLAAFGNSPDDVLDILEKQTGHEDPAISGAAIAGRLRLLDASAFAEVAEWCGRGELPEMTVMRVASWVGRWPGELVTDDILRDVGDLLDTGIPTRIRIEAVRLLRASMPKSSLDAQGPTESAESFAARARVAPLLIKALDDPDLEVRRRVIQGLYSAAEGWKHPELAGLSSALDTSAGAVEHTANKWKAWWQANGEKLPEPPPPPPPPAPGTMGGGMMDPGTETPARGFY
jgi:hypothetical protein